MTMIFDIGQQVKIRDNNWEIFEIIEKNSVQTLKVIGIDDENIGQPRTFLAPLENIELLPSTELKWHIGTPTEWNNFHNAFLLTMKHGREPLLSLNAGRVIIEDYQLESVIQALNLPKQRMLIADDVGLGKTIEAGLIAMELIARGRGNRILIITPAALQDQWADEMKDKFNLEFHIFDTHYIKKLTEDLPRGANPWNYYSHIITSIDYVKRSDIRRRGFDKVRWDIVIVDEAHYLCKSRSGQSLKSSDRSRLGDFISKRCDSFLLLTATPHNGYSESYFSLIQLIDPFLISNDIRESIMKMDKHIIRRSKNEILNSDGSKKFQAPISATYSVELNQSEKEFYELVSEYCDKHYEIAIHTKNKEAVGFTMMILKKRLLSSLFALQNSVNHRIKTITEEIVNIKKKGGLISDYVLGGTLTEDQIEHVEQILLGGTVYEDSEDIKKEKIFLENLQKKLKILLENGDPKINTLFQEIKSFHTKNPKEKIIIFTEYRDTQTYINNFLSKNGYQDQIVIMNGGLNRNQRIQAEKDFAKPITKIMIATDAASEGLNFQEWCHIIMHNEIPWNPNRLEQRNGRVARWGQKFQVQIINFIIKDSYEFKILKRVQEKIQKISEDIGSLSDVIGITSDLNIQEFLMGIRSKEGLSNKDLNVKTDEISKLLEQKLEEKTELFKTWRAESLLKSSPFGSDNYKKVEDAKRETESLIPSYDDVKKFLLDVFKLEHGEIKEIETDIFQITVPQIFRGAGVEPSYPRATFNREKAIKLSRSDDYIEFLTPYHPLIKSVLRSMRTKLYDSNFRGRMSYRVLKKINNLGILFTYYVRFQDSSKNIMEESIIPIFIDFNGNCEYNIKKNFEILREGSEKLNVSNEKIIDLFKEIWPKLKEISNNILIERFIPEKSKTLLNDSEKLILKKRKDIETWLEGEEKYIKKEVSLLQQDFKLNKTGTIDDYIKPTSENPEKLLNRKIAYKGRQLEKKKLEAHEQLKKLEDLKDIESSKELLLGALFVIPLELIEK